MYRRKLSQIFLVCLGLIFNLSTAQAVYWKNISTMGGADSSSESTMAIVPESTKDFQLIDQKFSTLKLQLEKQASLRMPATVKIQNIQRSINEFLNQRKNFGYAGVRREIEMDLYLKSIHFWVYDPKFSTQKCANYKHQFLLGFEPQADETPVTEPLDQSFQILDKTCKSST